MYYDRNDKGFQGVVRRFTLYGVHGYKNLSVDFISGATVIAAQNGAGKTTLLGALNAFLTRRFHRLASYSFDRLECDFGKSLVSIVIDRKDLPVGGDDFQARLSAVAEDAHISPEILNDFLSAEYDDNSQIEAYRGHPVVQAIYYSSASWPATKKTLDLLIHYQSSSLSPELNAIREIVRNIMEGVAVVYLPTYRRVELPLLRSSKNRSRQAFRLVDNMPQVLSDMVFGLGDVERKLKDMLDEIERISNIEYRSLSAKMLGDLLKPASAQNNLNLIEELPDIEELSRFLTRLGRADDGLRHVFKDIENLYSSQQIFDGSYANLRLFLLRLKAILVKTRKKEKQIEGFVEVCNSFLGMSSDEKVLSFDPLTLSVVVKNKWIKGLVPFDALSSGEKQIISLMSKLYLDDGRKIILIDEPELSLSIPWQKKVLPSMLQSGAVTQLLAITHSPFVFDNDLEANAAELKVEYYYGEAE